MPRKGILANLDLSRTEVEKPNLRAPRFANAMFWAGLDGAKGLSTRTESYAAIRPF